jgi:nitroimidazol reductase NimA-like FMN-containing flavoprotein (pyridoxamine 5'-phosphate oxidase superfamily)
MGNSQHFNGGAQMAHDKRAAPAASRPSMPPPYGLLGPTEGQGLLPWTWASERLARSRGYWLATSRPDRRPHVAVVWGVWLQDTFYFATSSASRKARNLAANPSCVVCPEQADEAVIVEGVAAEVMDTVLLQQFQDAYAAKYQEAIDTAQFSLYGVRPRVAFAFISDAVAFPRTATRWQFDDE